MLGDERWVPEDSDRSNARLVKNRLLTGRAAGAHFVPFYTGDETPEQGAGKVSDAIQAHLPITLLLLGMGDDMHTASLFPGSDELPAALEPDAPAVMAVTPPDGLEPRLTLTYPALSAALDTHVLITGAAKRAAYERALQIADPKRAPIAAFLGSATVHWSE